MKQAIPLATAAKSFAVNRAGQHEVITQPLYDYQAYAAAGQVQLTFFQVPVGQSSKTQADTNMEISGMLPAGKQFLLTGIEVVLHPGNTPGDTGDRTAVTHAPGRNWTDIWTVYKSGLLRLFIGTKDYVVDAPIGVFPQSFRLAGAAAVTDQTTIADASFSQIDYAAMSGRAYEVVPMFIPSQQNFRVTLEWPAGAVALPSGVAGRVGVRLLGVQYRNSQ